MKIMKIISYILIRMLTTALLAMLFYFFIWLNMSGASTQKANCVDDVKFGVLAGELAIVYPKHKFLYDDDRLKDFFGDFQTFATQNITSDFSALTVTDRAFDVYQKVINVYLEKGISPEGHEKEIVELMSYKLCGV